MLSEYYLLLHSRNTFKITLQNGIDSPSVSALKNIFQNSVTEGSPVKQKINFMSRIILI